MNSENNVKKKATTSIIVFYNLALVPTLLFPSQETMERLAQVSDYGIVWVDMEINCASRQSVV